MRQIVKRLVLTVVLLTQFIQASPVQAAFTNPYTWSWTPSYTGRLRLYVRNLMTGAASIQIRVTVAGSTRITIASLSAGQNGAYDVDVDVSPGTAVTIVEYDGGTTATPGVGWVAQNGDNTCGINGYARIPISDFKTWIDTQRGGRPLESFSGAAADGIMCWGDFDESGVDQDYNDFAVAFSYAPYAMLPTGDHWGNSGVVTLANCLARGWAADPDNTGQDLSVRLVNSASGVLIATTTANQYNPSLASSCSGGTCQWSLALGTLLPPFTWTSIEGQAYDSSRATWTRLPNSPRSIYCQPAPLVDVLADGADGPVTVGVGTRYTISWASQGATGCSGSDALAGVTSTSGTRNTMQTVTGSYPYSLNCANSTGSASDSVLVNVVNMPAVDLKVDGSDGPLTYIAPATFTLSWSSQNATYCSATATRNDWNGGVDLSGAQALDAVSAGAWRYSLTCSSPYGSASDAVDVTVLEPLGGTIAAEYSRLLWYAPSLGQPAQTLRGTVTGGIPPYQVSLHVLSPSGIEQVFSRSTSTWTLSPDDSGDADFGCDEKGSWRAWAEITDVSGQTYRAASAVWTVSFFPVHGIP